MLYILDANVFVDAERDYYSFEVVPEFWPWLAHMGQQGSVKMPQDVYEEIISDRDRDKYGNIRYPLSVWAKDPDNKKSLILKEEADIELVQKVIVEAYGPDLSDIDIAKIGRDPFLIAHALSSPSNRTIVTNEVSKPGRKGPNRHIPDVCKDFSIQCLNTFQFVKALGFTTKWEAKIGSSE